MLQIESSSLYQPVEPLDMDTDKDDNVSDTGSIIDDCDGSEQTLQYGHSDSDSFAGTPLRMTPELPSNDDDFA